MNKNVIKNTFTTAKQLLWKQNQLKDLQERMDFIREEHKKILIRKNNIHWMKSYPNKKNDLLEQKLLSEHLLDRMFWISKQIKKLRESIEIKKEK